MPLLGPGDLASGEPEAPHTALEPAAIVRALRPHLRRARRRRIERVLAQRLASVTVVLEHPYDPHNGAAVLRTAEALGVLDVHVVRGAEGFAFSRKVTVNAHKWLNVYVHADTRACLRALRAAGYGLWAALPPTLGTAPVALDAPATVASPAALVFGNEHAGLTEEAIACCDAPFHLPMFGFGESFNLSVSVALALQPLCAARRAVLGRDGDVVGVRRDRLRAAYYARSARYALRILCDSIRKTIS
ncbi:MAG: RNA methyltransferase [Proteobacteria bacterium]|nr:MAG: RNA methyltransferase [Pseudomonadota bacterium]